MKSEDEVPARLKDFMYAVMKEASRNSLKDVLERFNLDVYGDEYGEIERWFKQFGIKLL